MCCRARTPKFFQVRSNMMIKKNLQQPPFFSHVLLFVDIGCSNKKNVAKMLPNNKEKFLFGKFSSKSHTRIGKSSGRLPRKLFNDITLPNHIITYEGETNIDFGRDKT